MANFNNSFSKLYDRLLFIFLIKKLKSLNILHLRFLN